MRNFFLLFLFSNILQTNIDAQINPSFEDVISLQSISSAQISPDGRHVVFEKGTVDWEENRYDRELWISKNGAPPLQLTNNHKGNSDEAQWSPDGKWIAFLSNRSDNTQIHVLRTDGGEPFQVTHTDKNITDFKWSPDGSHLAFIQAQDKEEDVKKQKEKFGGFAVEDAEYELNELWIQDFNEAYLTMTRTPQQMEDSTLTEKLKARKLLDSIDFSINYAVWSPDGKMIAIEHQPDPLRNSFFKADISIYNLENEELTSLVSNLSYDGLEDWSPDSRAIVYSSHLNDSTSNYYLNNHLFRINIDGTGNTALAKDFDEDIYSLSWNESGIFALAYQKTTRHLIRIDPVTGSTKIETNYPKRIRNYSFSKDGKRLAVTAVNDDDLTEVYQTSYPISTFQKVSNSSQQIEDWLTAQSDVISWKSKDGVTIEGILHKPKNFDPDRKYPLLIVIHGGPTGISTSGAVPSYVYPQVQWLNKGALILRPNYRGSAGYGEKFRSLNVRNLGVGDAWDVLSGVEYLENQGIVDGSRVGAMGWSQGGYISAFLTTNSNKFKAISVGAGISNWMTYYVNTDIHPFTRQYLKATPWSDKEIYEKTSPMTNIKNATTPTLIQHGEFDRRVPTPNAYELYQGLQDVGVETKLIIYKGFGHGINKPKERLAAIWHNWQWFGKYLWDEDIEIPD